MVKRITKEEEIRARYKFIGLVREYMRDHAELNTLVEGEESDDKLIWSAIDFILDDFNTCPPPLSQRYVVANFPSYTLLRDGVVLELLQSAALLLARNALSYQHGGTAVSLDQHSTYLQIAQLMRSKYESDKVRLRVSINTQEAVSSTGGHHTILYYAGAPIGVRLLDWSFR